jgi:hypothetical protein
MRKLYMQRFTQKNVDKTAAVAVAVAVVVVTFT